MGSEYLRRMLVLSVLFLLAPIAAQPAARARAAGSSYNWLQFNGNPQHSGNNTGETTLTSGNVAGLTPLFSVTLPSVADGAPVVLSGVTTPSGPADLVYLTTRDGRLLALDAHTGAPVWSHQYGPGSCHINNGTTSCYTTSSPAIDPSLQYVYSYGLDGRVHKYAVGDGTEVTSGGWPELVTTKPFDEKESPALAEATWNGTSYLYVANGGYPGDNGDYQGHLTVINLATGSQHIFNALCSNQIDVHFVETPGSPDCSRVQSAVWARPGVIYDPDTNRIYAATGNGDYNPASFDWGDSVFALNPDGTGSSSVTGEPLDSYTPTNYATLQSSDADLGSTAPAILPVPVGSSVSHLAVQGGKDSKLRLLDLDNLSGQGGPGHTGGEVGSPIGVPQGGEVLTQPAVWTNPADSSTWVFVGNGSGLSALKLGLSGSTPTLTTQWQHTGGVSSPLLANNVLYVAGSNKLQALDPTTGSTLWSSTAIGPIHWESPVVANGILYLSDESARLSAFTLPSSTSTTVQSASSTRQYALANSDGSTWQDLDGTNLSLTLTPGANTTAILSGNADLWTSSAGYNQDLGIVVSGGSYGTGQLVAWKESGGIGGTYSPNAASVLSVLQLSAGVTYTVKLQWKANRADPGTIWAGAGPIGGSYSPTRLTAELVPASSSTGVAGAVSTRQYSLVNSDGTTWQDVDGTNLVTTIMPAVNSTVLLSGNTDLWTSSVGYNQDLGIWISGGSYGSGQLLAWKESGGGAAYSPNAAYVLAVAALQGGVTYTVKLRWKSNRADPGTIWAGAGPIGGQYSPTRLTAVTIPSTSGTVISSVAGTQQYTLANSDGNTWQDIDGTALKATITPSANVNALLSGNADLWTSQTGYNQDLGIWISGGTYGTGTLVAWKESGGFAGAFSPNAAFVQTVLPLQSGVQYTVKLQWKANRADPGMIWVGAGPIAGQYSPTRLTAELVPAG